MLGTGSGIHYHQRCGENLPDLTFTQASGVPNRLVTHAMPAASISFTTASCSVMMPMHLSVQSNELPAVRRAYTNGRLLWIHMLIINIT